MKELLQKLYSSMPATAKAHAQDSVERMCALDTQLGCPSKHYPIIHVAGTNGKGSLVHKISCAAMLSGLKVGIYISPHLESFRERMQIADPVSNEFHWISQEAFKNSIEQVFDIEQQLGLTLNFFEIMTGAALKFFAEEEVDLVLLEVGVGGRFDSTNFITPILSIITSIGYDHCKLLGNTLDQIGWQKAGIIKERVPVALGPSAQISVILEEAKNKQALVLQSACFNQSFDEENSALATLCLKYLKDRLSLTEKAIIEGVQIRPACRFEVFAFKTEGFPKYIIFDVAHNEDGFRALVKAVRLKLGSAPLRFFLGMSHGKELERCIRILKEEASYIHIAAIDHFKLLKAEALKSAFVSGGCSNVGYEDTLEATLEKALQQATVHGEFLVVCGSFYIMQEIKHLFNQVEQKLLLIG
ncbi:MAG: hypothetical protein WCG10_05175 [Chlamydiota bacterium]